MNAMGKMFNELLRARAEELKAKARPDDKANEKARVDALKRLREAHETLESACQGFSRSMGVDDIESALDDVRAAERDIEQLEYEDERIDGAVALLKFPDELPAKPTSKKGGK